MEPTTLIGTTISPRQVVVVPPAVVYLSSISTVAVGEPVAAIFARPKTAESEIVTFPVTVVPGATVISSNSNCRLRTAPPRMKISTLPLRSTAAVIGTP